jgi:cytochrome c5
MQKRLEKQSMSAQHGEGSEGESQGLIRTPKQLIAAVLIAFVVPIASIVMLSQLVTGNKNVDPAGSNAKSAEVVAERLRPVGQLWLAGQPAPAGAIPVAAVAAVKVEKDGEAVYKAVCAGCHAAGTLNAPKFGDKAAWAKLLPEGLDGLTKQSIAGIRQMPARGGNPDLSDNEMKRAVAYMANAAGASFKAPPVAAPAAAPAAAAAAAATPVALAAAAPAASADTPDGEAVYKKACSACHASGAAGAPRSGDKAAWAPRIKKGEEALVASVIKGLGVMPPRGGNPKLSDAEVRAAVQYQIKTNR